ncbi:type II toxin-antitoxin system VapC family toxin [Pusillimonas noertemannii]|uniref:Ribonuclease VapC n=1 Tax=Pusillimonas noertemannii TaxID=305977 RepID=A0A2U1CPD3_9BURK|nr:type II toxin-antitoxin system VapC family toxin [Pusillimonas noertemannii]NYT67078.1 type II toxin-antitoxin system VapC family toxin [Pusillimonas noertemannii]PVY67752.1 tRNA(fMet)-specific endonuclease VapC [Pusillimonas noertemannii]TFL12716.1 type II toxin-antitoxin system VapC family toxin [Pusillimonas noertemannii]
MKYLLDTNAVIALLKGHPGFLARLRRHRPADFAMPSIVVHELFYGAYKGRQVARNLERVQALQFQVLDFDREDAQRAGELRALLSAAGTPIGPYDVLIAGQAWARGLTLITHNMREFRRIAHIRVEDWEA